MLLHEIGRPAVSNTFQGDPRCRRAGTTRRREKSYTGWRWQVRRPTTRRRGWLPSARDGSTAMSPAGLGLAGCQRVGREGRQGADAAFTPQRVAARARTRCATAPASTVAQASPGIDAAARQRAGRVAPTSRHADRDRAAAVQRPVRGHPSRQRWSPAPAAPDCPSGRQGRRVGRATSVRPPAALAARRPPRRDRSTVTS